MTYRPEIDGLRAIAVLSVAFYHAGLGVPGGYIGVDVFFVISGYLIASTIQRDLREGTFTFTHFWAQRVRRILPALCATVLGTILLAWCVSLPPAIRELGESICSVGLITSNYFFCNDSIYFDTGAETQPLLHTWSLSLEEQFYLVLPLLLWALATRSTRSAAIVLAVLSVPSFLYAAVLAGTGDNRIFFLLPARAWELLAGAVVAFIPPSDAHRVRDEVFGTAGLLGVLGPAFFYSNATPFPGLAALPVILGTVLLLRCASPRGSFAGALLASKPFVFVGLVSYSFYLWHWPPFAFAAEIEVTPSTTAKLTLLVVAFVVAALQWWGIERPFRYRCKSIPPRYILCCGLSVLGVMAAGGAGLSRLDAPGFVADRLALPILEDVKWNGSETSLPVDDDSLRILPLPIVGAPPDSSKSRARILLWGDSHAMVATKVMDQLGKNHGVTVYIATQPGTIPVPGLRQWGESNNAVLDVIHEQLLERVQKLAVQDVVLIASWSSYVMSRDLRKLAAQAADSVDVNAKSPNLVFDQQADSPTVAESLESLRRRLSDLRSNLASKGVRLWVVLDVPANSFDNTAFAYARHVAYPWLYSKPMTEVMQTSVERRRRVVRNAITAGLSDPARLLDPAETAFDGSGRLRIVGPTRSFYRDATHLTHPGADAILGPLLKQVFEMPVARGSEFQVPP